jgi:hypothetical protein
LSSSDPPQCLLDAQITKEHDTAPVLQRLIHFLLERMLVRKQVGLKQHVTSA